MNLTRNFELKEFVDNQWATADEQKRIWDALTPEIIAKIKQLAINLQVLRDYINKDVKPGGKERGIIVNIGFRPKWWELARKRSGNSKHCLGEAGDITVPGMDNIVVASKIENLISQGKMKKGGLHAYNTFVHYDIRGVNARW